MPADPSASDRRARALDLSGAPPRDPLPALVLMLMRGYLLWLVVPLGAVSWLLLSPWLLCRRVTVPRFLGWFDLNLGAFLQRVLLRPFFVTLSLRWVPFREASRERHRIGLLDFE